MSDLARQYKPYFQAEVKELISKGKKCFSEKIKYIKPLRGFKLKFKQKVEEIEGTSIASVQEVSAFKGRLISVFAIFNKGEGESFAVTNYGDDFKGLALALSSNIFNKVEGSVYGVFNYTAKGRGSMSSIYSNLVEDYNGALFSLFFNKIMGTLRGLSISPFLHYRNIDGTAYAIVAIRCLDVHSKEAHLPSEANIKALIHLIVRRDNRQVLKVETPTF